MKQVRCVRPFGTAVPGDLAEVPDGAAVDPAYWEPAGGPEPGGPSPAGPGLMQNPEAAAARLRNAPRWPAPGDAPKDEM